jgi:hypothetical protein
VAGRTPHAAEASQPRLSRFLSSIDKDLAPEAIEPPSTWTHSLDPRWDRVIMRCLETSPTDRPQNVDAVLAGLKREPVRKWPFVTAGAIWLLLAALFLFVTPLRPAERAPGRAAIRGPERYGGSGRRSASANSRSRPAIT